MIVKLEEDDFAEARGWFYLKIKSMMNVMDAKGVLQLPDDNSMVKVSKVIPLPTFLVPLFMNEGRPRLVVASFQAFVDEFFEVAPSTIKKYTRYIFDFLLAASGSEDKEDHDEMVSQLVIDMEEMELNPVIMQWASTHFSMVEKIALQHDKRMEKEVQQAENTRNRQETSLAH